MLSSAEERAFSRTCRLREQGLDLGGQGLQIVFRRPRTSLRTPPLVNAVFCRLGQYWVPLGHVKLRRHQIKCQANIFFKQITSQPMPYSISGMKKLKLNHVIRSILVSVPVGLIVYTRLLAVQNNL